VLDPGYLDAVDTSTPGGLSPAQLVALLTGLLDGAVGLQVTIFDPDLDPSGAQARLLAETLAEALGAG
jgi:arginase